MPLSPVDICNIALSRVGVKSRIASLDERSEEARLCNLNYETVLESLLESSPWPFATTRADLVLFESAPNLDWGYRYYLPQDCVRAQYIDVGGRYPSPLVDPSMRSGFSSIAMRVPFKIEATTDGQGKTLLTDQSPATLCYTTRAVPAGLYPAFFSKALSWALAAEIAFPLTAMKPELVDMIYRAYTMALASARSLALNEGQSDPEQDSEFVTSRY